MGKTFFFLVVLVIYFYSVDRHYRSLLKQKAEDPEGELYKDWWLFVWSLSLHVTGTLIALVLIFIFLLILNLFI